MSVYITEIDRTIYASSRYPSIQEGLTFYDSSEKLKISDKMPLEIKGFYYIVSFKPSHIFLSRDVLGSKPLYYSKNSKNLTISNFKWYFDEKPLEVMPGEVLKLSYNGEIVERRVFDIDEVFKKIEIEVSEIPEMILRILERIKIGDACISFSGGVDSSILAAIYDAEIISVTSSKDDEEWIRRAAKMIGKDVEIMKFGENEVRECVSDVIRSIETTNPLQVSIAIPIHLCMRLAREIGYRKIVFGQGADELFGGYKRYENLTGKNLEKVLEDDLKNIGVNNLERDCKIAYRNEMAIITPYLNWDMISLAISIPPEYKVRREDGKVIRKYILREAAKKVLPKEIAMRDKKAIQYSTKTYKILEKIARRKGVSLERFLRDERYGDKS